MKKIKAILAVAVVAMIAFSGCSDTNKQDSQSSDVTATEDTLNSSQNSKSLNNDIDYSDTYVPEQDSQEYLYSNNFQSYGENEDSFFQSTMTSEFIKVIDKKTLTFKPLCNKTDCLHDGEENRQKSQECGAYIGSHTSFVYNDGRLFYDNEGEYTDADGNKGSTVEFYSIKTDGSDRKLLYEFKDIAINWFKVHRGYIYFQTSAYTSNDVVQGKGAIWRIPVNGSSDDLEELIPFYNYGEMWKNITVDEAQFYGNYLYMSIYYTPDTSGDLPGEEECYEIKFNLETKEWSDLNEKLEHKISIPYIVNGKFVYQDYVEGSETIDIYECDLNGENEKKVLTVDERHIASDGKHLVSYDYPEDPSPTITYYDSDYNRIATYKMPTDAGNALILGDNIVQFKKLNALTNKLGEVYLVDVSQYSDGDTLEPKLAWTSN